MRHAAWRAVAVCVVLLMPGPRLGSREGRERTQRSASSVVLVHPAKPPIPEVITPPPFLLGQASPSPRTASTAVHSAPPGVPQTGEAGRPRKSTGPTTRYRVVEGDSLWAIAQRFGTTVEALAAANGISEGDFLQPGQVLQVPTGRTAPRPAPATGWTYTVRRGDTLWAIALKVGVRVEDLASANGIQGDRLQVGQKLVIPTGPVKTAPSAQALSRTRRALAYLWPARGVVTSRFGSRWRRHHAGVDIAAPRGTPIRAARDGRVVRAGWYGGYGLVVVLDHGDGMETWYGHASAVLVRVGQWVERGQAIARVGCTGACTGPHVHFEVRVRGYSVNPLRYLP